MNLNEIERDTSERKFAEVKPSGKFWKLFNGNEKLNLTGSKKWGVSTNKSDNDYWTDDKTYNKLYALLVAEVGVGKITRTHYGFYNFNFVCEEELYQVWPVKKGHEKAWDDADKIMLLFPKEIINDKKERVRIYEEVRHILGAESIRFGGAK